jgi:hypothetical protein
MKPNAYVLNWKKNQLRKGFKTKQIAITRITTKLNIKIKWNQILRDTTETKK